MKRKLLSVLLVLAMALTLLPTAAFAVEGPTIDKVVFYADGAKMNTLLSKNDAERDSLHVHAANLVADTTYALGITYPAGANHTYTNEKIDETVELIGTIAATSTKTAGGYYISLNPWDDSANKEYAGLVAGEYTVKLYTVDNNSTPQYTEVAGTEQKITLAEVTVDFGADKTADNLIKKHEDKAFYTLDGTTKAKFFVDSKDLASASTDAKAALEKLITIEGLTEEGNWSFATNTFTWTKTTTPTTTIKAVPANLTAVDGAQAPAYGHATSYTAELTDKAIAVTAEGLEKTKNTQDVTDYWVGVGLTKQEDATYAWGFGTKPASPVYKTVDRTQTNGDETYTTLYWSSDDTANVWSETTGYISVKVGNVVTDYTVSFNVKVKTDTPVVPPAGALTFSTLLDNEVTGGKIYGKAPETLGKFTVEQGTDADATKITVTGTANYITGWTEFNGDPSADENNGHYLPIHIEGAEGQKITITGKNAKEFTFGNDKSCELVMFLDKLTNSTFTVTVVNEDVTKAAGASYTIDCSGVVLLPKVEEGEVADTTKVVIPSEEATKLSNLIKDTNNVGDATTKDAPVRVIINSDDGSKTLTFTAPESTPGTPNKGHEVKLPSTLASTMGNPSGDSKADVKVNSGVGSVTVPSAALTGADADVTVSINETAGTGATVDTAKVELAENAEPLTDSEKTAITTAVTGAKVITVEAKKGSSDLLAGNDSEAKAVTITITGLDNTKTYVLLCVTDDGKVTSFGEFSGDTSITVTSTHLTKFIPVVKTDANKDALAKVALDDGKVTPAPVPSDIVITSAVASGAIGRKVTVTGLTAATVTVQIARPGNTAPAVVFNTPKATAENGFNVNAGSVVTVWDGVVTFAGGVPSAPIPSASDPYTVPANS